MSIRLAKRTTTTATTIVLFLLTASLTVKAFRTPHIQIIFSTNNFVEPSSRARSSDISRTIDQSQSIHHHHQPHRLSSALFSGVWRRGNAYDARGSGGRAPPPPEINERIKHFEMRVIAPVEDGEPGEEEMLGVMTKEEALAIAEERGLDLVLINDKTDVPICKIIDYGKFKYFQEKKQKENAKKQVKQDIKVVKMSYKIDQHDFDVRLKSAKKFIGDGDRVKVLVQFKGREMQHKELGRDLLMKLYEPLQDIASLESPPKVEGRAMGMLLGPKVK